MADYPVEVSVVVPVFNGAKTLSELYNRLRTVLEEQIKTTFELIFVDDYSTDNSWGQLKELRKADSRVKIIKLARNYGQHNATICGFNHCSGRYVVTIDDDLQHPPEELPRMLPEIRAQNDAVFGVFAGKKHSLLRKLGTEIINYLQIRILGKPKQIRFSSFRILRREVVERIIADAKSEYCYLSAYILKYAAPDKIANIQVAHHCRRTGRSNYTIAKMFNQASNLIINYSAMPLRLAFYAGLTISAGCLAFAFYFLVRVVFWGPPKITGSAFLAFWVTFLFGAMFLFLGIIGEYIFRILRELSGSAPYIIQEAYGLDSFTADK